MSSSSTPEKANLTPASKSSAALRLSVQFWFIATILGQWTFAAYVVLFFGKTTVVGDFSKWNNLPHGYEAGNTLGNVMLIMHLLPAAVLLFCGPLQFVQGIRARFPKFHRWSGKIYLLTALVLSVTGLYLGLSGRKLAGDSFQHNAIILNAILIILLAVFAFATAVKRDFKAHRRWAMRLFTMANGVWHFRIGLFSWLMINGGKPVGFDYESFSGPFLTLLALFVYIFSLLVVELYIRSKEGSSSAMKIATASLLSFFAIIILIGTFAAAMGVWLPKVQSVM